MTTEEKNQFERLIAKDVLLAMADALDFGDQPRYAALFERLKWLHSQAASRIRARNQWKVPHP